ncbi:MAG: sigma-70 factor domain-containing protein, partial [Sphaerospermopsis kisseleviana]
MYQTKQLSQKETMNLAELGTMEILDNAADHDEPSLDSLEAVVFEDSSIVENLESDERDGDEMAAARPSGYNKTEHDDAVGAFFKEMARYPLLKPDEEVELAHRVRFLEE